MERRIAVILVSEHELFRAGLAHVMRGAGYEVHVAATPAALRRTPHGTETVVVDVDHTGGDVATLLEQAERLHDCYVIAFGSAHRLSAVLDGVPVHAVELRTGERGLLAGLARKPPTISFELKRLHGLWSKVTPRQRDVLRWLAIGLDNVTIGRRLRIGERAVKAHVSSLLTLFGLNNRTELALLAQQAGLRPPAS